MRQIKIFLITLLVIYLSGCSSASRSDFDRERAAQARLKLGLAYLDNARQDPLYQDLAYQNLLLAQQYSPENRHVLLGMALFHQQVGENDRAADFYQRLLTKAPLHGPFLIHYGNFLCQTARYDDAQIYFNAATNLNNYQWKMAALEQIAYCDDLQKAENNLIKSI